MVYFRAVIICTEVNEKEINFTDMVHLISQMALFSKAYGETVKCPTES